MTNIEIIDINLHKAGEKIWILTKDITDTTNLILSSIKPVKLTSSKKEAKISSLDIRKNQVIKISKAFFINLSNLININLSDNLITKISNGFEKLKNLKTLRLDNNQITHIPSFLSKLDKLEIISLCGNLITKLPTSMQYLNSLQQLKLSRNNIITIPIEFGLLKSLEILHIDTNSFTEIPTTLCYLKNLKELNFEWLEFTEPPYQKHLRDGMGYTIISFIRKSLQDLIKMGILYCPFKLFIDLNSQDNINLDIFNDNSKDLNVSNKENTDDKIKLVLEMKKKQLSSAFSENDKLEIDEKTNSVVDISKYGNDYTPISDIKNTRKGRNANGIFNNNIDNDTSKNEMDIEKTKEFKGLTDIQNKELERRINDKENKKEDNNNYNLTNKKESSSNINIVQKVKNSELHRNQLSLLNQTEKISKTVSEAVVDLSLNDKETEKKIYISNPVDPSLFLKRKRYLKIFYAIENNMKGVVKSLLNIDSEYHRIKNPDGRNALYLAIHLNNNEMTDIILDKLDILSVKNNHIYLHKAIRSRNYHCVRKLLQKGLDPDKTDDQGSNTLHILFNSFTKELSQCALIADELMKYKIRLNLLNKEQWAPIHIASRRASIECLHWIIDRNRINIISKKELFDFNLCGKSGWSPLHLAVNGYRFQESMLILAQNVHVSIKNDSKKTPKHVANGNYLMTKILKKYENIDFNFSYLSVFNSLNYNFSLPFPKYYRNSSGISSNHSFSIKHINSNNNKLNYNSLNVSTELFNNSITNINNINNFNNNNSIANELKVKNKHITNHSLRPSNRVNSVSINLFQENNSTKLSKVLDLDKEESYSNLRKENNSSLVNTMQKANNNIIVKKPNSIVNININSLNKSSYNNNDTKAKDKSTSNTNNANANANINNLSDNVNNKFNSYFNDDLNMNENKKCFFKLRQDILLISEEEKSILFHQEIILNNKTSYTEKLDSLMKLKLISFQNKAQTELIKAFKIILENLDCCIKENLIIITEILNITVSKKLIFLIPFLEKLLFLYKNNNKSSNKESKTNKTGINNSNTNKDTNNEFNSNNIKDSLINTNKSFIIQSEVENSIKILNIIKENEISIYNISKKPISSSQYSANQRAHNVFTSSNSNNSMSNVDCTIDNSNNLNINKINNSEIMNHSNNPSMNMNDINRKFYYLNKNSNCCIQDNYFNNILSMNSSINANYINNKSYSIVSELKKDNLDLRLINSVTNMNSNIINSTKNIDIKSNLNIKQTYVVKKDNITNIANTNTKTSKKSLNKLNNLSTSPLVKPVKKLMKEIDVDELYDDNFSDEAIKNSPINKEFTNKKFIKDLIEGNKNSIGYIRKSKDDV